MIYESIPDMNGMGIRFVGFGGVSRMMEILNSRLTLYKGKSYYERPQR
jgi:hypothetical protein